MSLKRETPCDFGECPYSAEYNCDCEYWCGVPEPEDYPDTAVWECRATYADGTEVEYLRPCYEADDDEQYQLECELIERHPDCTWYSVNLVF